MELFASLMLSTAALLGFAEPIAIEPQTVEIGLAETSPRGQAGGYAIPASGCSDPDRHNHDGLNCSDNNNGIWLTAEVEDNLAIPSGGSLTSVQGAIANVGLVDAGCHSYTITIEGATIGSSGCTQVPIPADGVARIPDYPVSYTAPTLAVGTGIVFVNMELCVDNPSNTSPAASRCDTEPVFILGPSAVVGPEITANGENDIDIVDAGGLISVVWEINGNTNCTLSQPLPGGVQTTDGSQNQYPTGQITYTISCDEGADSVTVYVLPEFQET